MLTVAAVPLPTQAARAVEAPTTAYGQSSPEVTDPSGSSPESPLTYTAQQNQVTHLGHREE